LLLAVEALSKIFLIIVQDSANIINLNTFCEYRKKYPEYFPLPFTYFVKLYKTRKSFVNRTCGK